MPRELLFLSDSQILPEVQIRCFERIGLPTAVAAADYEGTMSKLISEFKKTGNLRLISLHCSALARAISDWFPNSHWVLIPIPSSSRATRQRGFVPAELVARQISKAMPAGSRVIVGLWQKSFVADQAGLSIDQREANLFESMSASPSLRKFKQYKIALVDDLVTTGATAREGVRAMSEIGIEVSAVFALGETLRKHVRDV